MRFYNTVGIPHRVQFIIIIHILKDSKAERMVQPRLK